jgi:glycosyltransferase involved in cell wall biosynthesis
MSIKTKVLTYSASRLAGGLFQSVRYLHQTLRQCHNVNVRVFALRDQFTDADEALWSPLTINTFPVTGPQQFGYSPALSRAILKSDDDIGHTHGLWVYSSVVTLDWHRKTGRPYLISPHGMLDPWALNNSRWKKKIAWCFYEREHLQHASCLRALCASEAHSIRQLGLKNHVAIIPNGIDLPVGLAPSAPPWQQLVEPGRKVLLFLSRIHPKKGLVNLVKAWEKNYKPDNGNHDFSDWLLAIAGWDQGGHESELKRLATDLGLTWADIRDLKNGCRPTQLSLLFLGPQFDAGKVACYHHCEAFILPSFSEGLPMVVLEAWAHSKPVIMTPECNLPEGFQAGAAIRVEANVSSLVAGLGELRRMSSNDRLQMGGRARDLVVKRFTWSRVADQLQSVHQWILGGGPEPACLLPE